MRLTPSTTKTHFSWYSSLLWLIVTILLCKNACAIEIHALDIYWNRRNLMHRPKRNTYYFLVVCMVSLDGHNFCVVYAHEHASLFQSHADTAGIVIPNQGRKWKAHSLQIIIFRVSEWNCMVGFDKYISGFYRILNSWIAQWAWLNES